MHVAALLAEEISLHPALAGLPWNIWQPDLATATTFSLGGMHTEHKPGGNVLVLTPAPDVLPLVTELHEAGWKRGGEYEQWGWHLSARLDRDGMRLVVSGPTHTEPAHGDRGLPYFAGPPPELPERGPLPSDFRARWDEWQRKCREEEW